MDLIKLEFPLSVLLDLGFPGRKKIQTLQALRPHMFIHRFFVYIYGNLYATKTGFRITATHPTTKLLAILQWHPVPCYFMFFLFFFGLFPWWIFCRTVSCIFAWRLPVWRSFVSKRSWHLPPCLPEATSHLARGHLHRAPVESPWFFWHGLASNIWRQNVSRLYILYIHIIFISSYLDMSTYLPPPKTEKTHIVGTLYTKYYKIILDFITWYHMHNSWHVTLYFFRLIPALHRDPILQIIDCRDAFGAFGCCWPCVSENCAFWPPKAVHLCSWVMLEHACQD